MAIDLAIHGRPKTKPQRIESWNEEHWAEWIERLATTEAGQCKSRLAVIEEGEVVTYCCLGLGSEMVPGIRVRRWIPEEEGYGPFDPSEQPMPPHLRFGVAEDEELAPMEFIEWLGISFGENVGGDIIFDFPEDLTANESNYLLWDTCTASGMNDAGFTFKQIADVARYFGPLGVR